MLLHPGGGGSTAALSHKTMRSAFVWRGGASAELLSMEALGSVRGNQLKEGGGS